jgi:Na+-translocating ferredoxin:NAD+ oxidoreductase RnfG subunit
MKEFLQKTYVHYAIVLGIVALSCGLLVGLVNFVTTPIIEANNKARIEATYNVIIPSNWKNVVYSEVDENYGDSVIKVIQVKTGETIKGYILFVSGKNQYGNVTLAFCFDTSGTIVGSKSVEFLQTRNVTNSIEYIDSLSTSTPKTEVTSGGTISRKLIDQLVDVAKNAYKEVVK